MTMMITKAPHDYGGRRYQVGDEFEAEPKYVPILTALGSAVVKDASASGGGEYATRVMTPGAYQTKDRARRVTPKKKKKAS